jgi:hypothetical protein
VNIEATETEVERLIREEREEVEWRAEEPPQKPTKKPKPSGLGRRKLRVADGYVFAFPSPDQERYLKALGV